MVRRRANINIPVVLRMMGWLLMIEAVFMAVPLIVGLVYDEMESVEAFLIAVLVTLGSGALMTFGIHPRNTEMHRREGLLLTASIWFFFSLFGMLPFLLDGALDNVTDAFFEAVSGFTTTGASVMTDVESASHSTLMWRAIMNWIGGMGIILFTLAVIPMLNHQGGIQLFNAEVTGITHDKLRPRISQTAKSLWMVYALLTVLLAVLLWLGPMNAFDAICQSFATVSTGGFSTRNTSIAWWDSTYVEVVITIFMFIGGINVALIYTALTGKIRALTGNGTVRAYAGVVLVFVAICALYQWYNGTFEHIGDTFFTLIAAMTSTGFSVTNYDTWGPFTTMLLMVLMFCGACAGSTTGGAKIDRMILLVKNTFNEFYRVLHPNSITTVRVNGKIVPGQTVMKVIAFLSIYLMIFVVGGIILTALGLPVLDAMFASLTAISNIGLGTGITGPEGSFAVLPDAAKWIMAMMMLIGRLELFTVLIIFSKDFWVK